MNFSDTTVLLTGGTGTFGKAFLRLCPSFKKTIIFSRDEFKQHNLQIELINKFGSEYVDKKFRFFLGDVRDIERLRLAFKDVDVIVHAAALKHVPFCEYNPGEALLTNVTGTKNVCDVAIERGVKTVICLSTDKAVEPINFYGSTKMLAERYAIHSNVYAAGATAIACVRYGNIIGSRGSIVETFRNQGSDKPFDITHPEMTRFWMHIDDAVKMVNWSISHVQGGEVIVPNIRACSLVALARTIDIARAHRIVGIRPGEKLHEQLIHRREHENMVMTTPSDSLPYNVILPETDGFTALRQHYLGLSRLTHRKSYFSNDPDIQMTSTEIYQASIS